MWPSSCSPSISRLTPAAIPVIRPQGFLQTSCHRRLSVSRPPYPAQPPRRSELPVLDATGRRVVSRPVDIFNAWDLRVGPALKRRHPAQFCPRHGALRSRSRDFFAPSGANEIIETSWRPVSRSNGCRMGWARCCRSKPEQNRISDLRRIPKARMPHSVMVRSTFTREDARRYSYRDASCRGPAWEHSKPLSDGQGALASLGRAM